MPPTYNPNRLKVQLKLAVNRLKLMQQKKNSINKQQRKEISSLLEISKIESAKIRVEGIIREDYFIEAMEMLELYCELLMARFGLIEQMKQCDPAIIEAVNTLIYSAPRSEIKELGQVRDQLIGKYGKEFALNAIENKDNCVNERIIQKLMFNTPDPFLVNRYLEEIAKAYNVNWKADADDIDNLLSTDTLIDSQVHTNNNGKSETTYTALPDMDLLMSLDNDAQDEIKQSKSTLDISDNLLPDVPTGPPTDHSKNNLGVTPLPPEGSSNNNNNNVNNNNNNVNELLPPPYSKINPNPDNSKATTKTNGLTDDDELIKRFEALKRR